MSRSGPYNLSHNINIYLWLRTNRINKCDPFWALVNLVRENNSTDVMNAVHNILPDVEGCDNEEEKDACIVGQTQTDGTLPLNDLTILALTIRGPGLVLLYNLLQLLQGNFLLQIHLQCT